MYAQEHQYVARWPYVLTSIGHWINKSWIESTQKIIDNMLETLLVQTLDQGQTFESVIFLLWVLEFFAKLIRYFRQNVFLSNVELLSIAMSNCPFEKTVCGRRHALQAFKTVSFARIDCSGSVALLSVHHFTNSCSSLKLEKCFWDWRARKRQCLGKWLTDTLLTKGC